MPTEKELIFTIVGGFVRSLTRIAEAFDDVETNPLRTVSYLRSFGWDIPLTADFSSIDTDFLKDLGDLRDAVETGNTNLAEILEDLKSLLNARKVFASKENFGLGQDFPDEFTQQLPSQLVDYALIEYLADEHPAVHGLLTAMGIISVKYEPPSSPFRIGYMKREVRWSVLKAIITQPDKFLASALAWGTEQFDGDILRDSLETLARGLGLSTGFLDPPLDLPEGILITGESLYISLVDWGEDLEIGLELYQLDGVTGVIIIPYLIGNLTQTIEVLDSLALTSSRSPELELKRNLGIKALTSGSISLEKTNINSVIPTEGEANLGILIHPTGGLFAIGNPKTGRLSAASANVNFGLVLKDGGIDLALAVGINEIGIVLGTEGGDGFINRMLPGGKIEAKFDLLAGLQTGRGLYIRGSGGFDLRIPIHKTLGPVSVDSLQVLLAQKQDSLAMILAGDFSARLGPVTVGVEGMGVYAALELSNNNLSGIDVGFKAPQQVDLVVSASGITGGGYLKVDQEKGEYTGILDLSIQNKLSLKAFGILTASGPGQPADFSLYLLITAEFTAIQLGYGFRLTGIGGMLGINRTMALEALQAGVKTGAVDSILFPQNPIANAPVILSNIRNFFPLAEGRFILGLMVRIDWGGVPLIELKAGVIIELPAPPRIVLLGSMTITLPSPIKPLVDLKLDLLGWIYPEKNELGIDATLHDSRLLDFPISGDMLMRLRWGSQPIFVLSLGGFHPRFAPPPGLPAMTRLAVNLAQGDTSRLRLEAYLALTANSLQFGARLDLFVKKDLGWMGTFSVSAYLGFDTLIRFNPFYFLASIEGNGSLRRNGKVVLELGLSMILEGPNPWHAWGNARFNLGGFIKGKVSFNVTSGTQKLESPRPSADPKKLLSEALLDPTNWSSSLPDSDNATINFRNLGPEQEVVLDPAGYITFRQRVTPLGQQLSKFGEAEPVSQGPFTITAVKSDGVDLLRRDLEVKDYFAAAQFFNLSEDEKLSRPSFELFACGVGASPERRDEHPDFGGLFTASDIDYEQTIDDELYLEPEPSYEPESDVLRVLISLGAAGQAAIRRSGAAAFRGPDQLVTVTDGSYDIADPASLQSITGSSYSTYIQARKEMQDAGRTDCRVVGLHEVSFGGIE
jgi:hypothetical protein